MIVIDNEKPFRLFRGCVVATLMVYIAIHYSLLDKEDWVPARGHFALAIYFIHSQTETPRERIARIEIQPLAIRIYRDNGMMREIAISEIGEIPVNDLCARIDYRREGYPLQLLLEKKFFTDPTWEELCSELKKIPVSPTNNLIPTSSAWA